MKDFIPKTFIHTIMLHHKFSSIKKHFRLFNYFIFLMVLRAPCVLSQDHLQDVVFTHNGSIYRGIIKEKNTEEIKIEITGGTVFVLSKQSIDSVRTENQVIADGFIFRQKAFGYFSITQTGIAIGQASTDNYYWYAPAEKLNSGFTAQTIHGIRFYSHYLAGAGIGIDLMQHAMLQSFIDLRYEVMKGIVTPFAFADAGYNFDLSKTQDYGYQVTRFSGGPMWAAGAGMRFNFKNAGAFLIDAGFRYTRREEDTVFPDYGSSTKTLYNLRRAVICMGLAF
jgi:hypothetical protein